MLDASVSQESRIDGCSIEGCLIENSRNPQNRGKMVHLLRTNGDGVNEILFILVVAGGAIVIVFLVKARKKSDEGSENALGILRTRYAEGKISREEYQEMLKDLKK